MKKITVCLICVFLLLSVFAVETQASDAYISSLFHAYRDGDISWSDLLRMMVGDFSALEEEKEEDDWDRQEVDVVTQAAPSISKPPGGFDIEHRPASAEIISQVIGDVEIQTQHIGNVLDYVKYWYTCTLASENVAWRWRTVSLWAEIAGYRIYFEDTEELFLELIRDLHTGERGIDPGEAWTSEVRLSSELLIQEFEKRKHEFGLTSDEIKALVNYPLYRQDENIEVGAVIELYDLYLAYELVGKAHELQCYDEDHPRASRKEYRGILAEQGITDPFAEEVRNFVDGNTRVSLYTFEDPDGIEVARERYGYGATSAEDMQTRFQSEPLTDVNMIITVEHLLLEEIDSSEYDPSQNSHFHFQGQTYKAADSFFLAEESYMFDQQMIVSLPSLLAESRGLDEYRFDGHPLMRTAMTQIENRLESGMDISDVIETVGSEAPYAFAPHFEPLIVGNYLDKYTYGMRPLHVQPHRSAVDDTGDLGIYANSFFSSGDSRSLNIIGSFPVQFFYVEKDFEPDFAVIDVDLDADYSSEDDCYLIVPGETHEGTATLILHDEDTYKQHGKEGEYMYPYPHEADIKVTHNNEVIFELRNEVFQPGETKTIDFEWQAVEENTRLCVEIWPSQPTHQHPEPGANIDEFDPEDNVWCEDLEPGYFTLTVRIFKILDLQTSVVPPNAGFVNPSSQEIMMSNTADSIKLRAIPLGNHEFVRWKGDASGTNSTYDMPISPAGMTDPAPGTYTKERNEIVPLEAWAYNNWSFSHWGGDIDTTDPSTSVTMDESKTAIAYFTKTKEAIAEFGFSSDPPDPPDDGGMRNPFLTQ
jgi:hypothetical protein